MYKELIKRLRDEAETERYLLPHSDNGTAVLLDEAADAIEELKRQIDAWVEPERKALIKSLPRWIPVTERLPENDDFVIVAIKDEHGDSPYVYSDFGWYFDRAECWIVDAEQRIDITHWMPLPKAPEEGE